MACRFCYNHGSRTADISVDAFEQLCRNLPSPTFLKLLGGEPTVHPQLPQLLRAAKKYQHGLYVSSNGLRYSDDVFMHSLRGLKEDGVLVTYGISLDGGITNRNAYLHINGTDCLDAKMAGLHSLVEKKIGRVCLSAIIIRGINEDVIGELIDFARAHDDVVRYIHFRTAAEIGVWEDTQSYTMGELTGLVREHFSAREFTPTSYGEPFCPDGGCGCCFRFRPTKRLQVSLIEFGSKRSEVCHKRGMLQPDGETVRQFFSSMRDRSCVGMLTSEGVAR